MGYIVCFGMRHNVTTAHLLRSQGLLTLSVEIKKSQARAHLSNKKQPWRNSQLLTGTWAVNLSQGPKLPRFPFSSMHGSLTQRSTQMMS